MDQLKIPGRPDSMEVTTVTPQGIPVSERIQSVAAARSLWNYLVDGSSESAIRRARLKGLIDGNPPYDPAQLEERGLGYTTNVNFLMARAILDQKAGADYELFFEVPTLVEVRPIIPNPELEPTLRFGDIIAEEFSNMLLEWPGFLVNRDRSRRQADAHGFGLMLFENEWDWRPRAFDTGNVFVAPDAEVDVERLAQVALYDVLRPGQLFQAIADEARAEKAGWDVAAVKQLLIKVYLEGLRVSEDQKYYYSRWENLQQKLRNNDWLDQKKEIAPIDVAQLLIAELDSGEVSHYIFLPKGSSDMTDRFLFRKVRRYKRMTNAVWLLPANNADTYIRSCRGLGSMIEHHCDLANRFLGRAFDAGFTQASLLLQPSSTMDLSKLQLLRLGIMTVIPPGLNVQQSTFAPQVGQMVQLLSLSSDVMKNNTGVYRQHPESFSERQPDKTARQVVEEVAKEARLEKANIAFDLYMMTQLYSEMFRRATNPRYVLSTVKYPGADRARKFATACIARGVPLSLLLTPDFWRVQATRPIGMGSWGTKLDISNQVLDMRGLMDEAGQRNAFRDWLGVRVGQQNVDRYSPLKTRDAIPTNEHSIATLENSVFTTGARVPVGSDQSHAIHFIVHAKPVQEIIQMFEETLGQGMDIAKALQTLQAALPQLEGHLQYLAQDPARKAFVEKGQELLQAGVKTYEVLSKLVKKALEEAQKRQEEQARKVAEAEGLIQNREFELERMKVAGELQLSKEKLDSLNAMRVAKTQEQLEVNRQRAVEDMRLKGERQSAELAMDQAVTEAKISGMRSSE